MLNSADAGVQGSYSSDLPTVPIDLTRPRRGERTQLSALDWSCGPYEGPGEGSACLVALMTCSLGTSVERLGPFS